MTWCCILDHANGGTLVSINSSNVEMYTSRVLKLTKNIHMEDMFRVPYSKNRNLESNFKFTFSLNTSNSKTRIDQMRTITHVMKSYRVHIDSKTFTGDDYKKDMMNEIMTPVFVTRVIPDAYYHSTFSCVVTT